MPNFASTRVRVALGEALFVDIVELHFKMLSVEPVLADLAVG